ncbi:hypothetical protein JL09_g818 [Pichia kudriavzevii]|uniref:phosphatidylserine decarboxylase n=1 Tax=Pichia kudriavzevii TaxID=4909 RepID=A0A099P5C2_PICKU|nr:hypothetical protein JL09_g818 [Pichia kudriavzevii]
MDHATQQVFNNQLVSSGVKIPIVFSVQERLENGTLGDCRIKDVSILKDHLTSSIIFDISKNRLSEYTVKFEVSICNLASIQRLQLNNDSIKAVVYLENEKTSSILETISLKNLLELGSKKVSHFTKTLNEFHLDLNFSIDSSDKRTEEEITNHFTTLRLPYSPQSDLTSLPSYFSSDISSTNQSFASLNSLSPPSRPNSTCSKKKSIPNFLKPSLKGSSKTNSNIDISTSNPDLYHEDTDGFLILQIESATGLPPFKKKTQLGYDMDPFVVVSFSKQIYKTNVCRHALNPSWKNQLINIRVSKYSLKFLLKLSVYDFDVFTFNDDICSTSLEIGDLINESEHNSNDTWTYKKLPLSFSDRALSKKLLKTQNYMPELSIRFKYVPVSTLAGLVHSFNPTKTRCPYCHKLDKKHASALQHLSICRMGLKPSQFLHKHYTTSNHASRRWYVKILAHIAYGRLTVGGNNAHILVQDRVTGLVLEEKISVFVKLGIRLLYKSVKSDNSSEKIKKMLRSLSIKQGAKYDKPSSKSKIEEFVKFHGLKSTLVECENPDLSSYRTFNEFFSRKLKSDARPLEGGTDNQIIVSVADSRLIVFNDISSAKNLWIKGNGFTVDKLLGRKETGEVKFKYSIAIFRLAPQDYHRVHLPLNGKIVKINHIHGSYYTVNPMAIRSALDVFGENVRTVITLETEEYGDVELVMVGAMMVGSIILSVKVNDIVKKGQELGYFKFGGSTVILVFRNSREDSNMPKMVWDGDLLSNSNKKLETLVKVGMSVGHSVRSKEFRRGVKKEVSDSERREIIRRVTGIPENPTPGVGDNIKAKLGGMIDDVMSTKSVKSYNQRNEIENMLQSDWEIKELTTLEGLNDNGELRDQIDIDVTRGFDGTNFFHMLDDSDEYNSLDK